MIGNNNCYLWSTGFYFKTNYLAIGFNVRVWLFCPDKCIYTRKSDDHSLLASLKTWFPGLRTGRHGQQGLGQPQAAFQWFLGLRPPKAGWFLWKPSYQKTLHLADQSCHFWIMARMAMSFFGWNPLKSGWWTYTTESMSTKGSLTKFQIHVAKSGCSQFGVQE